MTSSPLRERAANGGQPPPGTDVETRPQQGQGIGGFIAGLAPQIQRALPRHLNADRMARLALTEVRKNPKLAECTSQSFAGALLTAAGLGLEVGSEHDAYLVPYEHHKGPMRGQVECQLIVKYTGLARLFWQHPLAAGLDAQAVYERDEFDYAYGTAKFLRHKPAIGERGKVVCYYAVAELTTGASHFVVLSPDEVRKLRGGRVGTSGQIDDPQRWMERKTALRQCLKTLPKSSSLAAAIDAEDRGGSQLYRDRVVAHEVEQTPGVPALPQGAGQQPPDAATEPPPTPPDNGELVSDAQKRKLHATLTDLGITTHEDRTAYIGRVLGEQVASSNDLTRAQASIVIDVATRDLEAPFDEQAPPEDDGGES